MRESVHAAILKACRSEGGTMIQHLLFISLFLFPNQACQPFLKETLRGGLLYLSAFTAWPFGGRCVGCSEDF
jgi:hypothetical protein